MKPSVILPIIAALVGFSIGWLAKPAPAPITSVPQTDSSASQRASSRPNSGLSADPESGDIRSETEVPADSSPIVEGPSVSPSLPSSIDDAKLLRLNEILNLTSDQQTALSRAISESSTAPTSDDALENLSQRADFLQKSLEELLTPEQSGRFRSLLERHRDNAIEVSAQRELASALQNVDFSSTQRGQALELIRSRLREERGSLHPSIDLVLEGSPLPMGSLTATQDSIAMLRLISQGDSGSMQPFTPVPPVYLEVLTPAQRAQLEALQNQKRQVLDRIPGLGR